MPKVLFYFLFFIFHSIFFFCSLRPTSNVMQPHRVWHLRSRNGSSGCSVDRVCSLCMSTTSVLHATPLLCLAANAVAKKLLIHCGVAMFQLFFRLPTRPRLASDRRQGCHVFFNFECHSHTASHHSHAQYVMWAWQLRINNQNCWQSHEVKISLEKSRNIINDCVDLVRNHLILLWNNWIPCAKRKHSRKLIRHKLVFCVQSFGHILCKVFKFQNLWNLVWKVKNVWSEVDIIITLGMMPFWT